MFDELYSSYRNIISNIAIIGYSENDILNRGNNLNKQLELKCLFIYPNSDEKSYNELTYEMMFPEGNHKIECPKFFSLGLTDEKGKRTFLYCLKFPEKFKLCNNNNITEINVPLVICIKSEKSDLEPFRQLLTSINQIIVSENLDYDSKIMNNYKKVELMNILYFIFSLPHTPPHSLIRLKLNNDICEVEDEIDFYFSSNCELPCNKNDTDVNLLFLILDQSIIIKVIIAILSEKQIVFRASQAYLLHLIIPTFLKLIFPFKWIHSCITILGKENIDFLDTPGSFIFGILSYTIQTQEILDRYPGVIIVDCDTNEIFGENNTDPFVAPKDTNNEDSNLKGSKKSKHKSKNKEIYDNISGGIKQGKNIFIVQGSYIYLYDPETKGKGPKMKFTEKNNIIIDTQKGQFLINKSNGFINSEEWKWLRKNIQLVRNPEIFDIENIDSKKKKSFESKYLKKISETNSEFMEYFKSTNLYLNYLNQSPFQNNSGHRIIENIKETINDPRSIDNCFIVEYNKRPFYCLSLLDELEKKIIELKAEIFGSCNSSINLNNSNNSNLKNEVMLTEKEKKDKFEYYSQLKNILMDYCLVLGINFGQGKNDIFNNDDSGLPRISLSSNKSKLNHFKNNYHKGHKKSNNSLLQFTFNQNPNFNLAGIDKFSKNFFKFYGKDGFLYFLKDFEEFMRETRKDFENTIFKMKIYQQLINIYKNLDNIFKRSKKENEDEINIDIDDLNKDFNEEEEENEEEINLLNNIPKNINNENNKNYEIKDEENNENKEENNNSFIENEEKDDSNFLNLGNKKIIDDLRSITSIRKTKNSVMSMIAEKDEENESYIERTTTKKFTNKSNNEELGNTLLNNINLKIEENLNDENENIQKDEIIVFPYFEHKKERVLVGKKKEIIIKQLENDSEFLEKIGSNDYSLLLGIHNLENVPNQRISAPFPTRGFKKSHTINYPLNNDNNIKQNKMRNSIFRKFSCDKESEMSDWVIEAKKLLRELYDFDDGGILSSNGQKIYYIGIIDILTEYGLMKKTEHLCKMLRYCSEQMSCIPPNKYKERYINYMNNTVFDGKEYWKKINLNDEENNIPKKNLCFSQNLNSELNKIDKNEDLYEDKESNRSLDIKKEKTFSKKNDNIINTEDVKSEGENPFNINFNKKKNLTQFNNNNNDNDNV